MSKAATPSHGANISSRHSKDASLLAAAHIEVEPRLDQLQLWLPIDRPIIRGRGGLLTAAGLLSALMLLIVALSSPSVLGLSETMTANQFLVMIFASLTMVSVALLAAGDTIGRLSERLVDRYRPMRARRETVTINQHLVITERDRLGLDTIQSVSIEKEWLRVTLIAHTPQGAVPIAQHRSTRVMETLGEVIVQHATRHRQGLCARGQNPDQPAEIPQRLQELRQSSPVVITQA
ncbi:MAG: hypothetical protein P8R54_10160 [Myxococcota bacterium]|nr:hypothetical protein [Myxococcota bacterium]